MYKRQNQYCEPTVPNSIGELATVSLFGSNEIAANNLTVRVNGLPAGQFALLLASKDQGFTPNPGGNIGNLCLAGDIGRFTDDVFLSSSLGSGEIALDLNNIPQSNGTVAVQPGETWNFQVWYRNFVFEPIVTTHLTEAVSITFP